MGVKDQRLAKEQEIQEKLARVLGMSHEKAAQCLGLNKTTVKNWRRQYPDFAHTDATRNPPPMTPQIAAVYAQLLHAGCPALRATEYVAPQLQADVLKLVTKQWLSHRLVLKAVEQLTGGAWMELPPERRYELSLQKHLSELAFYLYANNFNDAPSKEALEMFKQAREVLKAELRGVTDDGDPMSAFARFALELVKGQMADRAANSSVPIDLQPEAMDRMHESMARVKMPKAKM